MFATSALSGRQQDLLEEQGRDQEVGAFGASTRHQLSDAVVVGNTGGALAPPRGAAQWAHHQNPAGERLKVKVWHPLRSSIRRPTKSRKGLVHVALGCLCRALAACTLQVQAMHQQVVKGYAKGVAFTDHDKVRQLEQKPEEANLVASALSVWQARSA